MTTNLTADSLDLFLSYAKDAGNWGGTPLVGGNVQMTVELRGNLTDLKQKGLVETFKEEGCTWLRFTDAGRELAESHGVDID